MNVRKELALIFSIFYIFAAGCDNKTDHFQKLSARNFLLSHIHHKDIKTVNDIGIIENVVKLEAIEGSYISYVQNLKIGPGNNIYIAEKNVLNSVLIFSSTGKMIKRVGVVGGGPGEYIAIKSYDIDTEGNLYILASNKLLKYNSQGLLVSEIKLEFRGNDIICMNKHLYVSPYYAQKENLRHAILVFDDKLIFQNSFFPFDETLDYFSFLPISSLARNDSGLYCTDMYKMNLYFIDNKTNSPYKIDFGNQESGEEEILQDVINNEDKRREYKKNLHRYIQICAYGDNVYLTERCDEKKIFNVWTMNWTNKKVKIFPFHSIFLYFSQSPGRLKFNYIAGAYKNGIVCVIDDFENFEKFKNDDPKTALITCNQEDNPLVVFYKLI